MKLEKVKHGTVEKVILVNSDTPTEITITLTAEEARTLWILTQKTGGSQLCSRRKHTDLLSNMLGSLIGQIYDFNKEVTGSFYFKDNLDMQ